MIHDDPCNYCPVRSMECETRGRCTNKCGRLDQRRADVARHVEIVDNVYAYPRIRAITDWIACKIKNAWYALRYGSYALI